MTPTTPNHPASLYDRMVATVTFFLLTLGSCVFNLCKFAPRRSLPETDEEQAGDSPPQPSHPNPESPPRASDDLGDLVDDSDDKVWDTRLNLGSQTRDQSPPSSTASSSSQSAPPPSRRSGSSDSVPGPEFLPTLRMFHYSESPGASDSESGSCVEVSRVWYSSPAHLRGSLSLDSLDSEEGFDPTSVPLPLSPASFDPVSVPLPPSPPLERDLAESDYYMDSGDLDALNAIALSPPSWTSFRLTDPLRTLLRKY